MAGVIGIIGARLNSSRLPGKQLLDLAGEPMIARLFQRLEQVPELERIILATTADDYNLPLVEWCRRASKEVFAYDGDVNDVMGRVDAVVRRYDADIVCYICGDSPLVDPVILSRMIRALLEDKRVEHVVLRPAPGNHSAIHEGFYPYKRATWERMMADAQTAELREHVGAVLSRFADSLHTVTVEDEPEFGVLDHRISVDTAADYQFMSEIYHRWYAQGLRDIVPLAWVVEQLRQDPALARINSHVTQRAASDTAARILLVCHCSPETGLGHLSRSMVVARQLMEYMGAGVELLIQGSPPALEPLSLFNHRIVESESDLISAVQAYHDDKQPDAIVFDLPPGHIPAGWNKYLAGLKCGRVAIDGMFDYIDQLDLIYVPSFFLHPRYKGLEATGKLVYGWHCYLLPDRGAYHWQAGDQVLVMTGGGDVSGMGQLWPTLMEELLPDGVTIHWVQGPYAQPPALPKRSNKTWRLHKNPANLAELMEMANYGLAVYGVSLFEMLKGGLPTATTLLNIEQSREEAQSITGEGVTLVSAAGQAVAHLATLMADPVRATELSTTAWARMNSAAGRSVFAENIARLIEIR